MLRSLLVLHVLSLVYCREGAEAGAHEHIWQQSHTLSRQVDVTHAVMYNLMYSMPLYYQHMSQSVAALRVHSFVHFTAIVHLSSSTLQYCKGCACAVSDVDATAVLLMFLCYSCCCLL
jgi:hypothetical protein